MWSRPASIALQRGQRHTRHHALADHLRGQILDDTLPDAKPPPTEGVQASRNGLSRGSAWIALRMPAGIVVAAADAGP